jgi:hypothetical protein
METKYRESSKIFLQFLHFPPPDHQIEERSGIPLYIQQDVTLHNLFYVETALLCYSGT